MKTTSPQDYLELLEVFRMALTNGLADKSDIIKWADDIIRQDDEPDYFILELSLCGHKNVNAVITLIDDYMGSDAPLVSGRIILGLLYRRYIDGKKTLKDVLGYMLWIIGLKPISEQEIHLMYLIDQYNDMIGYDMYGSNEDYFYSGERQTVTIEQIRNETLRFIEIYKEFCLDNFSEWKTVDKSIDGKVQELQTIIAEEQKEIIQLSKVQAEEERVRTQSKSLKHKWWKWW